MRHYVIIPDLHVPYHCPKYIEAVCRLLERLKQGKTLKGIVQLGDALDFWQISSYPKNPRRKNTIGEDLEAYAEILNRLGSYLPKGGEFHQLEGNHEERLHRYIAQNSGAIFELVQSIKSYLKERFKGPGKFFWHDYMKWDSLKIGDVVLMHGFYFNQHVAAGHLTKYKVSTIFGHTHRVQYVFDGTHYAANLGHGSRESVIKHKPTPTGWRQAVGVLTLLDSGKTRLEIILVESGYGIWGGEKI